MSFSSAFAAGISALKDLSVIIPLNAKHGRGSQSTWRWQQLRLSHQNNPAPHQPACLVFCCQIPVGYEQKSPTEVMGITQKHIKPVKTK